MIVNIDGRTQTKILDLGIANAVLHDPGGIGHDSHT